jgi:hypothetical protein
VLEHAAPTDLQAAYLACGGQAATTLLDFGAAAQCSAIDEALKEPRRWRSRPVLFQLIGVRVFPRPCQI